MRNIALDLARGIVMIYIVVFIHGLSWLKIVPLELASAFLFEMPLIFIITGYSFALYSKNKEKLNAVLYWRYLKAKVSRIFVPYFAYAVLCIIIVSFRKENADIFSIIASWINPLNYGTGNNLILLNSHLWFIPTFLVVSLLLPLVRIDFFNNLSTEKSFLLLCLFFSISSFYIDSTYLFYFLWAYLGFKLGSGFNVKSKWLLCSLLISLIILALSKFLFDASLNIQLQKFPPKFIFLVFNIAWISIILLALPKIQIGKVNTLAKNRIISLFITYGYSIYIWQGLGYSLALFIKDRFNLNILITWFFAVVCSIVFGLITGPLEKVRWKQSS